MALIMPTGSELAYWGASAPAGFVMASGRTIGSAASGATERANADTLALFTLLWDSVAQTQLPIQTSAGGASTRGASAAADFAANKRMPLPDMRGRVGVGKDNMGGSAASRVTSSGVGNPGVDAAVIGAAGGSDRHTLTTPQMPSHTHTVVNAASNNANSSNTYAVPSATTLNGATPATQSAGGGEAHPNVQPSLVRNVIIKL